MDKCLSQTAARTRAPAPSTHELLLTPTSLWSYSLGGLAGRYGGHYYKDVRLVDPWSGQVLRFRTQLHADNWLLRAFDPMCISYCHMPEALRTLVGGRLLVARPSGDGEWSTGERFVDVVVREHNALDEKLWCDVRAAAACREVTADRRDAADLRANLILLDNLERMRSHLVRHIAVAAAAIAFVPVIVRQLEHRHACSWGETLARINEPCALEVAEFALYCGYRRGELALDVHERVFGPNSQVAYRKEAAQRTRKSPHPRQ